MRIKLLLFLLLFAVTTMATEQNVVAIYQQNGEVALFAFAAKPELSYSATHLIINASGTSVQYPINQLKKVLFEKADIDEPIVDNIDMPDIAPEIFSFRDGQIVIKGGVPNSMVNIYTVQGSLSMQYQLNNVGDAVIPAGSLRGAVFILQNGSVTFKFAKP
ncbi:MAG: hypothetical protein IJ911_00985 [Salinivirgaceae bacterium]|nr:hypothetical protein [Salinivirgaceae bacterium]